MRTTEEWAKEMNEKEPLIGLLKERFIRRIQADAMRAAEQAAYARVGLCSLKDFSGMLRMMAEKLESHNGSFMK